MMTEKQTALAATLGTPVALRLQTVTTAPRAKREISTSRVQQSPLLLSKASKQLFGK